MDKHPVRCTSFPVVSIRQRVEILFFCVRFICSLWNDKRKKLRLFSLFLNERRNHLSVFLTHFPSLPIIIPISFLSFSPFFLFLYIFFCFCLSGSLFFCLLFSRSLSFSFSLFLSLRTIGVYGRHLFCIFQNEHTWQWNIYSNQHLPTNLVWTREKPYMERQAYWFSGRVQ